MTEPKKVAFSTIGPAKKEKKRNKKSKSVRLNLTLAESNEKFCPEFNYRELVSARLHEKLGKKRLGDVINGPSLDPTDPFATDEDAALKALARQLENKYGSYAPTKKKRRKENDFSTLGEGYDETDPFIDNSDAFDEVVPTHMETKHRGFYINSGELDFEEVAQESPEEDSVPSDTEVVRRKPVKRIESDDEEEEEEEGDEEGSKGDKPEYENGIIRPKKRKLDEGELLRKRKKMIGKFNAKNLEKKDDDPEIEKVVNGCDSKGENQPNELSIAASIEAVISKAREEAVDKKSDSQESASGSDSSSSDSDSSGSSSSSDSDSDEDEEEEEKDAENEGDADGEEEPDCQELENGHQHSNSVDDIPLPDNLPSDLLQVIQKLKEEGHASKGSSQKFFTEAVNRLLLSIVFKLNKLGSRKKTQIYNHLSQHLPCGTQTIVKRSKNLLTEKQECRIREPLKRLQELIDAQMPTLVEQHALECQKAAESKGENGMVTNEEEEGGDGEKKKCKLPKKKFVFNDEIRKYLCEVVKVRVQFWHLIKKRSETPEEHIRAFLDEEVRPLWPKGWMNTRILFQESYTEHSVITGGGRCLKTTPVKKTVSLGGGSAVGVPSVNTQPPKPSLSATVIPKNFSPSISSSPKSDISKKKPVLCNEQKTSMKVVSDVVLPPPATASIGLSIKSVEKINEGADRIVQNVSPLPKPSELKEKSETVKGTNAAESNSVVGCEEKLTTKKDIVNVIDLSSDDDRTVLNKISTELNQVTSTKSSDSKENQSVEKDKRTLPSTTSVIQKALPATSDRKKEDNLEEEMNLVMNELLQISKQKSIDEIPSKPSKQSPSKDTLGSSMGTSSSSMKEQAESKSQVQIQSHKQHTESSTSSISNEKYLQKLSTSAASAAHPSPSSAQTEKYSHKPSTPVQADQHPSKHHSSSSSYTSPVKHQRPTHHTSPVQDSQKASHSSTEHRQHHSSSSSDHHKQQQTAQHNSPTQHKPHTSVQLNSVNQSHSSPHLAKDVHQPKSMQHSQSHPHQTVNLQKSSQASASLPFTQQQNKSISDISHKKTSSHQQYSQPHQQQLPQKSINVSVSSWSKSDSSVSSKHSPESTKKPHTSWTSSSDMSVSRQKQQDDVQVVPSVDPLANLRMMHGLSVSNVNKKSSGSSSSTYHNPVLATSSSTYNPTSSLKITGSSSSSMNNASSSLAQPISSNISSIPNQNKSSGYSSSSSQVKHASSLSHSSSKSSKHTSNPKPRLDSYAGAVNQSVYNNITQEQLNMYKQMQQQKQSNHLTPQQQELWQQMNATSYLPGMGPMSNADMMKLVSQVAKPVDNFPQSGPYPNPGTPTSVSPHLSPYGDTSRGSQHSHHISPHHLHPTHGGSEQHRGQY